MKEINDDELQFVVRHYKEDALNADRALRTLRQRVLPFSQANQPTRSISTATRRIAASVGIALIVGASVACGVWYARQQTASRPQYPAASLTTPYRYLQVKDESVVLKYDNAPICDVLSELSTHYGRTLVLQSASASDRRISGEIEATSLEEVVEILEATLDIEIEIQDKTNIHPPK